MAIWYVDFEGSAGAGNGTSFANRSSSFASIVNAAANGDEVRVKASSDPVSIGSCTWTKNSTIAIPAGTTKDIYTDGSWTAANADVTCIADTNVSRRFEGASSASNNVLAAFTTGKIASYNLGSAQDFSAYEKISLTFWSNAAITNASIFYIALCSDTAGDTVVNTLTLPAFAIVANRSVKLLLDNGSPLGSSIQSIAIYATTDPGTRIVYIDNVFATNVLHLGSLISKDSGEWFAIRSISNNTITLGQNYLSPVGTGDKGYYGTTATAETFVSNGIPTPLVAAAATIHYSLTKTAVSGSEVLISGGWNRTDMSTRTGVTHISAANALGRTMSVGGGYNIIEYFMISSMESGFIIAGDNHTVRNCMLVGLNNIGILMSGTRTRLDITDCFFANCGFATVISARLSTISNCRAYNCSGDAFNVSGNFSIVSNCEAKNNTASGFYSSGGGAITVDTFLSENNLFGIEISSLIGGVFRNIIVRNNVSGGVSISTVEASFYNLVTGNNGAGGGVAITDGGAAGALISLFNFQYNEATVVSALNAYDGVKYISINENDTADNHAIYQETGTIVSDSTTRHTASGISWKLMPTASSVSSNYPLIQRIRAVPLKANIEHTVSVWARRNNTGLTFTFGCDDQGVSGLSAQSVSMTAAANTWEKLSLILVPTIDVVLDFYVSVYGGTTYNGWWDDFEVLAASKNGVASGDYGYANNGVYVTNYPNPETSSLFLS
jgi:hypothetical protein